MLTQATTPAEDEYLETIYRLASFRDPVPLAHLAERLAFSPISVNQMVRRMEEKDLVSYKPYEGVSLTPRGHQRAEEIVRRHRLWERLLADVLDLPWDRVHEEACRLEHATSDLLEERLTAFLEQPLTCPHGRQLPGSETDQGQTTRLSRLQVGEQAQVIAVLCEETTFLRALDYMGLRPGAVFQVVEAEPALHTVTVRVGNSHNAIATDIADQIVVRLITGPTDEGAST